MYRHICIYICIYIYIPGKVSMIHRFIFLNICQVGEVWRSFQNAAVTWAGTSEPRSSHRATTTGCRIWLTSALMGGDCGRSVRFLSEFCKNKNKTDSEFQVFFGGEVCFCSIVRNTNFAALPLSSIPVPNKISQHLPLSLDTLHTSVAF